MKTVFTRILALVMILCLLPGWSTGAWAIKETGDGFNSNIDHDINSTAGSVALSVSPDTAYSDAQSTVSGSVTAESSNNLNAVIASADSSGKTATVEISGTVSATSSNAANAVIATSSNGGTSTITVHQDATATSSSDSTYSSRPVIATAEGSASDPSSSTVTVEGNVSAIGTSSAEVIGVTADAKSDNSTVKVSVGSIQANAKDGNATGAMAESSANGEATIDVTNGGISSSSEGKNAYGIQIGGPGASSGDLTVNTHGGNITATSDQAFSAGISIGYGVAFNGSADIDTGDIVSAGKEARGISVFSSNEGIDIDVGNIEATSDSEKHSDGVATGVLVNATGTANMTINAESITAEAVNGIGTNLSSDGDQARTELTVNKDITASDIGILVDAQKGGVTVIDKGSITGGETGIEIVKVTDASFFNALVHETIEGKDAGIVVSDTVNVDKIGITVWKIADKTDDDHVVLQKDASENLSSGEVSQAIEKQIQYIIKMDPGITVDAPPAPSGVLTASEGTKVTIMKVNVPSGYQLTGAYNGKGEKVPLLKDSAGNYYINVPRGGGVYLSATWDAISAPVSAPSASSATFSAGSASSAAAGRYYEYNLPDYSVANAIVTFDFNGGHDLKGHTETVVKTVPVGTWLSLLDAPCKDGSTFERWYTEDESVHVIQSTNSFLVQHNVDFIAQWEGEELPYRPSQEEAMLVDSLSAISMEEVDIAPEMLMQTAEPGIEEEELHNDAELAVLTEFSDVEPVAVSLDDTAVEASGSALSEASKESAEDVTDTEVASVDDLEATETAEALTGRQAMIVDLRASAAEMRTAAEEMRQTAVDLLDSMGIASMSEEREAVSEASDAETDALPESEAEPAAEVESIEEKSSDSAALGSDYTALSLTAEDLEILSNGEELQKTLTLQLSNGIKMEIPLSITSD